MSCAFFAKKNKVEKKIVLVKKNWNKNNEVYETKRGWIGRDPSQILHVYTCRSKRVYRAGERVRKTAKVTTKSDEERAKGLQHSVFHWRLYFQIRSAKFCRVIWKQTYVRIDLSKKNVCEQSFRRKITENNWMTWVIVTWEARPEPKIDILFCEQKIRGKKQQEKEQLFVELQ